jgi:hypothetical protein
MNRPRLRKLYVGYFQFGGGKDRHGSFEVFASRAGFKPVGFFWWQCSPGALPDGDAVGPFPTAKAAYDDAMGDA